MITTLAPPQTMTTLSVVFNLRLQEDDLYAFRGAFAAFAGLENDLFHNHDNAPHSSRDHQQRYPLIQYRVHRGRAAVFALNDGARALDQILQQRRLSDFRMNGRACPLRIRHRDLDRAFRLEALPAGMEMAYRVRDYLPFSPRSYAEYNAQAKLVNKIPILERLLTNHVVAFAYAADWKLPSEPRLAATLRHVNCVRRIDFLGQGRTAFDLEFSVNARLPEGTGIGPKVAFGFGVTGSMPS